MTETFSLIPVRCPQGHIPGRYQIKFEELLNQGLSAGEALDILGIKQPCCRLEFINPPRFAFDPEVPPKCECGQPIEQLMNKFIQLTAAGKSEEEVLGSENLDIKNPCCRALLISRELPRPILSHEMDLDIINGIKHLHLDPKRSYPPVTPSSQKADAEAAVKAGKKAGFFQLGRSPAKVYETSMLSPTASTAQTPKPATRATMSLKGLASPRTPGKLEAGKLEAGKLEAGKLEAGKLEAGKISSGKPITGATMSLKGLTSPRTPTKVEVAKAADTSKVEISKATASLEGLTNPLTATKVVTSKAADTSKIEDDTSKTGKSLEDLKLTSLKLKPTRQRPMPLVSVGAGYKVPVSTSRVYSSSTIYNSKDNP